MADIRVTFKQVVPPLVFNTEAMKFAWQYDGVTWDQIKQGGIHKDFLPTFTLAVAATILLAPFGREKSNRPAWAIYLAAIALTVSTVFHSMGHTWYLFLSALLFATTGSQVAEKYGKRVQLTVLLLVLFSALVSLPRLKERIEFKLDNNREMSLAEVEAREMVKAAQGQYPCIRSAAFDVLIPWQLNDANFLPMRIALQKKLSKEYSPADLVVVNTGLPSGARSPLLQFVVEDGIGAYRLISAKKRVDLYIRKDLQCNVLLKSN